MEKLGGEGGSRRSGLLDVQRPVVVSGGGSRLKMGQRNRARRTSLGRPTVTVAAYLLSCSSPHHLRQALPQDGRLGVGPVPQPVHHASGQCDDVLQCATHLGTRLVGRRITEQGRSLLSVFLLENALHSHFICTQIQN